MMAVDILHLTRWLTLSAIEQLTKSAASASPTVPVGHASDLPLSPRAARVKRAMSMKDNSKKAINRYLSELKLKSAEATGGGSAKKEHGLGREGTWCHCRVY